MYLIGSPFILRSNLQLQDSENCSFREIAVLGINKVSFICSFYCQHATGGAGGSNELMSSCVNVNTYVIGTTMIIKINEHIIDLLITTGCCLLILMVLHLISSRVRAIKIMRCLRQMIGYSLIHFIAL